MTSRQSARRLVVPSITPPAARSAVAVLAEKHRLAVIECPVAGDRVAGDPHTDDLLVHSVPDVFGRHLDPSTGWGVLRIVDLALGLESDRQDLRYGLRSDVEIRPDRLAELWKPLAQQRDVRPVLTQAAPFGLAYVAPSGVDVPEDVTATSVPWPGLPDLVIVHHPEVSAWRAYDGVIELPEWT